MNIQAPDMMAEPQEQGMSPEQFISLVTQSDNLAAELGDERLTTIAQDVISDYDMDKDSMSEWLEAMKHGLKLAQLSKEDRNYPFKNAANVKFPLVTSAALQFNARAYPAIVPSDQIVKTRVWGNDPTGVKAQIGERIAEHMSYQLCTEIEEWEEDTDDLLLQLPIVGTLVRKWWFDPVRGRARCRVIEPGKFIVNDKVKSLADAPRCSEELPLYPNEIQTRIRSGQFVEFSYDEDQADKHAPQDFIEQHTMLDLDEDDLFEPYIVTVHLNSQTVVRIVADYTEADVIYDRQAQHPQMDPSQVQATGILEIKRGTYFVPYHFMPSMDGGFHGTGLGLLLGDISDTINSIMNMLLDAGHYASLGGGFIGSDFRMKGGAQHHRPGEWKQVAATGQSVRESIVPLTFPGPDATLYQMLGMLIEAGREIASVKDVVTGDSGNGPAQTATATIALIEQGMAVFTAAYKRIFRSLKKEYRLLANINVQAVSPEEYNAFHDGEEQYDPQHEYNLVSMDIEPVADPRSVTKMQEAAKAQFLMQMAEAGLVDQGEAARRMLEAMSIGETEKLSIQQDPQQQQMQQQMMAMQMSAAQADIIQKRADIELTLAKIDSEEAKAMKDMGETENSAINVQLAGLRTVLEDERDRLKAVLSAGTGGMAGQPGNGGPQGPAGPNGQGPDPAMLEQLLGGQAVAGAGQAIPATAGSVDGGLL